jgi:hypothetical protein
MVIKTLDPDTDAAKMLDPDPDFKNPDPQHWFIRVGSFPTYHSIISAEVAL